MEVCDIPALLETPSLPAVSSCMLWCCAAHVPISRHHLPVPHPISSMRFGRFSGANQFLCWNSALIIACCMSRRSFSAWVEVCQRRTDRE
jgi:hypothetical protein